MRDAPTCVDAPCRQRSVRTAAEVLHVAGITSQSDPAIASNPTDVRQPNQAAPDRLLHSNT
ncbi:hypothetical protein PXO_05660 [Xanthomonas oryzae pv. oryzae PXO99A]|uniref:Uncharacterized protein n=1 Tax=Xanthomonas oryzae pv. oryzae (strain PXO99A) TaxID=360094 RepID=A0A0K0GMC1_XANOP|nr:hypothetical protein PXO_05660 [Xanthomonas oryzae pv. oryzae PXO99A]